MFKEFFITFILSFHYSFVCSQLIESAVDDIMMFRNTTSSFQENFDNKSIKDMTEVVHIIKNELKGTCGPVNETECKEAMRNITHTAYKEYTELNTLADLVGQEGLKTVIRVRRKDSDEMDRVIVEKILGMLDSASRDNLPLLFSNLLNVAEATETMMSSFLSSFAMVATVLPEQGPVAVGSIALAFEAVKFIFIEGPGRPQSEKVNNKSGGKNKRNLSINSVMSDNNVSRVLQGIPSIDPEDVILLMKNSIIGYVTSNGDPIVSALFAEFTYAESILEIPRQ